MDCVVLLVTLAFASLPFTYVLSFLSVRLALPWPLFFFSSLLCWSETKDPSNTKRELRRARWTGAQEEDKKWSTESEHTERSGARARGWGGFFSKSIHPVSLTSASLPFIVCISFFSHLSLDSICQPPRRYQSQSTCIWVTLISIVILVRLLVLKPSASSSLFRCFVLFSSFILCPTSFFLSSAVSWLIRLVLASFLSVSHI